MRIDVLARRWGGPDGGPDGMAVAASFLAFTLCQLGHQVHGYAAELDGAPWQHPGMTWVVRPGLVAPDDFGANLIISTVQPSWHRLAQAAHAAGAIGQLVYWLHHSEPPPSYGASFAAPPAVEARGDWAAAIVLPPSSWAADGGGEVTGSEVLVPGAGPAKGGHVALEVARLCPDLRFLVLPGRHAFVDVEPWRALPNAEVSPGPLSPSVFLGRAAAVLSPTRVEVHPLALVEAAAHGIPIVTTDLVGCRAAAGAGALYVPVSMPPKIWASALRTVLEQSRPRVRLRPYAEVVRDAIAELAMRRAA